MCTPLLHELRISRDPARHREAMSSITTVLATFEYDLLGLHAGEESLGSSVTVRITTQEKEGFKTIEQLIARLKRITDVADVELAHLDAVT